MATEPKKPIKIFCSYARKDTALLDQLDNHLEVLRRSGKIVTWSDRDIQPGTSWKQEVDNFLDVSDILLLLVTPNYLSSKRCEKEMQYALERQRLGLAHANPLIMRPSGWQDTPLADLQVLPSNGKPVTTWRNRDEGLQSIVDGFHRVVTQLQTLQEDYEELMKRVKALALSDFQKSCVNLQFDGQENSFQFSENAIFHFQITEIQLRECMPVNLARLWLIVIVIFDTGKVITGTGSFYGLFTSNEILETNGRGEPIHI